MTIQVIRVIFRSFSVLNFRVLINAGKIITNAIVAEMATKSSMLKNISKGRGIVLEIKDAIVEPRRAVAIILIQ